MYSFIFQQQIFVLRLLSCKGNRQRGQATGNGHKYHAGATGNGHKYHAGATGEKNPLSANHGQGTELS
jgi:hypothetical protein